jgi:hypothetical protein
VAGTSIKCKKCGAKFRVIFGINPKLVSQVLERDCGYNLSRGNEPERDLSNVVCSACSGEEFEHPPLEEKIELQHRWMRKVVEFEKTHPGLKEKLMSADLGILRAKTEALKEERDLTNLREKLEKIDMETLREAAKEPDEWKFERTQEIVGRVLSISKEFKEIDILDEKIGIPFLVDVPPEKLAVLDEIKEGERWSLTANVYTAKAGKAHRKVDAQLGLDKMLESEGIVLDKLYKGVLQKAKKVG